MGVRIVAGACGVFRLSPYSFQCRWRYWVSNPANVSDRRRYQIPHRTHALQY